VSRISRVLVANRGEIAVRILRACFDEGLETALAGIAIGLRPMWAAGDTGLMGSFPAQRGVKSLTLIADHDPSGAGEAAALKAALRWRQAGREVRIFRPSTIGDLNDAIKQRAA